MTEGYPEGWSKLARAIKTAAGWRCPRCGHPHDMHGHTLTVHHIDGVKTHMWEGNLIALCRRCHNDVHRTERLLRRELL